MAMVPELPPLLIAEVPPESTVMTPPVPPVDAGALPLQPALHVPHRHQRTAVDAERRLEVMASHFLLSILAFKLAVGPAASPSGRGARDKKHSERSQASLVGTSACGTTSTATALNRGSIVVDAAGTGQGAR